jgi:hypothetical protein
MTRQSDWGVPDWRNATDYPAPKGRGYMLGYMLIWAWEFLRRNPSYRRYWRDKARHCYTDDGYIDDDALPIFKEAEENFGIAFFPPNPSSGKAPIFTCHCVREIRNYGGVPNTKTMLKDSEIAYIFDLSVPLDIQFSVALKSAKSTQTVGSRKEDLI